MLAINASIIETKLAIKICKKYQQDFLKIYS